MTESNTKPLTRTQQRNLEAMGLERPRVEFNVSIGWFLSPRVKRTTSLDREQLVEPWAEAAEQLRRDWDRQRDQAVQRLDDFYDQRRRDILLATLGESGDLTKPPSIEDFLSE